MYFKNYDNTIHFEIMVRIAKAFHSDDFEAAVDRIPQEMRPRSPKSSRCCIYRDRAIIKYRCMATLGFAIENEENELKPLSAYAREALERDSVRGNMITFIDEACNGWCAPIMRPPAHAAAAWQKPACSTVPKMPCR